MPAVSIIAPTFNEAANVGRLHDTIQTAMAGIAWELIFVDDDSPDGTVAVVKALAQADPRVRVVHRIGRRGLASACIEGILSSSAPIVAVIDADMQHDETLLPRMFQALQAAPQLDVVVGSRYVEGGGLGAWDQQRATFSRWATRLSTTVLKADLKDPMSGFFMIRHQVAVDSIRAGVSGIGFKILLDLFASAPRPLRHLELPYHFRNRVAGESKLDTLVAWEYFLMLLDHLLGGYLPVRFIAFSLVGGLGLLVHLGVLSLLYVEASSGFVYAQTAATLVAMTSNYLLNNALTYRDMRLKGWKLLQGWFSFSLACGVGAAANIGIASWFFDRKPDFWLLSALAGVLVGSVWNYAVTSVYTWRSPRSSPT